MMFCGIGELKQKRISLRHNVMASDAELGLQHMFAHALHTHTHTHTHQMARTRTHTDTHTHTKRCKWNAHKPWITEATHPEERHKMTAIPLMLSFCGFSCGLVAIDTHTHRHAGLHRNIHHTLHNGEACLLTKQKKYHPHKCTEDSWNGLALVVLMELSLEI